MRREHDTMGEVLVPDDALWGAQTQRAVENFPISGERLDPWLVEALAVIKGEAALVNAELGVIPKGVAKAIATAARQVAAGEHADQFPVDVFQTGSGTSSNMNVNEVLARLASRRVGKAVHPNDHVNASQSSNDVFPTAIHLAAIRGTTELLGSLAVLHGALHSKATKCADAVKAGRTHLMDATPVTLGQELDGYAAQVAASIGRLERAIDEVAAVPLGGTAVGTGLNCPPGFAAAVLDQVSARLNLPLREADDHLAAHGSRDALVSLSGELRTLAVALTKIANDLRWMGSGPNAGLAEIRIPDLQPGSSIMPGKVNPVLCEAVLQVCTQVIGNDAAVAWAGARGDFELNVFLPVMARNLLQSIRFLSAVVRVFAERCVAGIEPDRGRMRRFAESSPVVATSLNPHLGYELVAELVKEAQQTGRSVRDLVVERGLLDQATLDAALDVLSLTRPQQ
jgi:fumarate hydratase class II